jgi:CRP-like cAMP-binding protein
MSTSLDSDIEVLRRIPFFEGFSEEHLRLIAFSAESRTLPEKLLIYDEGQLLHSAYVLVTGTMRAERKATDGDGVVTRSIGAGVILGERALILDTRATEAIRVETKARVLQIRKVMFRRLLIEYPEITLALRAKMARTLTQTNAEFARVARRLNAIEI